MEGVVEVEPLATSPSVRVFHSGPCYPCTQFVGLPYMAHESHTEDTTFIVAESDFVFNQSDATTHLQWMAEEEERACHFLRYSEIADAIPEGDARQEFLRQLAEYEAAISQDKNAPWPADSEEGPGATEEASQWNAAKLDYYRRVSYAFFRPGKPSSKEPMEISDHLQDLQALFTRAARAKRGGFLWCGWNACQWTATCSKIRTTSPSTGAQLSMMTAKCAR